MEPTDSIVEFLQELGGRGHVPLLAKARGWVRLELVDADRTDHWLIAVDNGTVAVSHHDGPAECVVRGDRALFGRLFNGEENAISAVLRGALMCTGDAELLLAIGRLLPAPPRERERRPQSERERRPQISAGSS
jgi:predicted lipid carrier protein YhbT